MKKGHPSHSPTMSRNEFLANTLLTFNLAASLAHTFLEFVDTKYKTARSAQSNFSITAGNQQKKIHYSIR